MEQEEKEYCSDCERKTYHFDKGFAVWVYDDKMRQSIADFKYHGKKENAKFYIDEIIRRYGDEIKMIKPDVITPVPIHRSKLLERGYNQAELLAKGVGKNLDITV
jgi:predicted amidophosphoribosyltransferase